MFQQRADLSALAQPEGSGDLSFLFSTPEQPRTPLVQSIFQNVIGASLGAARGAALLPAGIEHGLLYLGAKISGHSPIKGPLEKFVGRTFEAEADLQEFTGHPFLPAVRGAGEFAGTFLTAGKVLQGVEALGASGTALVGAGALEGAGFAAGDERTSSPGFLGLGAALGAVGGAFAARSVARATQTLAAKGEGEASAAFVGAAMRASNAPIPERLSAAFRAVIGSDMSIPEGAAKKLAIARTNARTTASLPDAIVGSTTATNDAAAAGLRVQLSKLGKTGAAGTVRFVGDAPPNLVSELSSTVGTGSGYTFRLLKAADLGEDAAGDVLVYAKGEIPTEALDAVRKSGFYPGQLGRLPSGDAIEIRNIAANGEHLTVSDPTTGSTFRIAASDVAGLDETLGHASLPDDAIEQWRSLRRAHPNESSDEVFHRLVTGYADKLDTDAIPDLRRAISRSERAAEAASLATDQRAQVERFHSALASLRQKGGGAVSLPEEAAAHGYAYSERSGGRHVLTALPPRSDAGLTLPPFTSSNDARAFLRAETLTGEDLAKLDLPLGLAEMLGGAARSAPAAIDDASRNVEHAIEAADLTSDGAPRFRAAAKRFVAHGFDTLIAPVRGNLSRAAERLGRPEIFADGFDAINAANNRARTKVGAVAARLDKLGAAKLSADRLRIVDDYLASTLPDVFAAQHSMTPEELGIARGIRSIFNDMFADFSASSGSSLSFDDFWRYYSPTITDAVQRSGTIDVEQFFRSRGLSVPSELRFFGEQFNTGELGWAPQAPLLQKVLRTARAGYFKAEVGPAWETAANLAKTVDDPFVKRTMVEFLAWTRGNASSSVAGVRRAVDEFFDSANIPLTSSERHNILDMAYQGFYGAALGFRAGPVLRQVLQNYFLLAPMLRGGLTRFARVQAALANPRLFTKAGLEGEEMYNWAVSADVIPKRTPVAFSESTDRLLASGKVLSYWDTLNRKSLQIFGNFDELNRTTAAVVYRDLLREDLPRFIDGSLSQTAFARRTSLNMMGDSVVKGFFDTLETDGAEEAVKFGARNFAEFGNFIYGRQNAPQWVRGAFGHVLGQLSTFPVGYLDLLRTVMANGTNTQRIRWLALHGALGLGMAEAGRAAGFNLHSFVMWNTLGYAGGPWLNLTTDLYTSYREGGASAATKRVQTELPRLITPGFYFVRDVGGAATSLDEGDPTSAFFHLFGIREAKTKRLGEQTLPSPPFPRAKAQSLGLQGIRF